MLSGGLWPEHLRALRRVWRWVRQKTPLEVLVHASSGVRFCADGNGFDLLRHGGLEVGCAGYWKALLYDGFAIARCRRMDVCAIGPSSLLCIASPCAVFLVARIAPNSARHCLVWAVFARAICLALLRTLALDLSLPCGYFKWVLENFSFGTASGLEATTVGFYPVSRLCPGGRCALG